MSAIAAAVLGLSGCGGGGGDTAGTTTPTTPTVPTVTAVYYDGLGAADAEERHVANDALPLPVPAYDLASVDTTTLKGNLTGTVNLVKTTQYKIDGLVTVEGTLNIQEGTVIFGDTTGDDFIVVKQGGTINAIGTAAEPIIFTSETALMDPSAADVGQWGGLTILGYAPTNHGEANPGDGGPRYEVDETNPDFTFGNALENTGDAADNSGTLQHVYIMNSGVTMSTDQEVNGLSLAGVGSGTTIEDITIVNSSDDGIEIWGGTVDVTRATMINCQDDSFDLDYGYIGNATDIKVYQTTAAHAGFEISSGGNNPMTAPTITNFVISKVDGSDEGGIYIKDETTAPTFINGEVMTQGSTDAGLNTRKATTSADGIAQIAAISFTDVLFNSAVQVDGLDATAISDFTSTIGYAVYDSTKPNVVLSGDIGGQTLVKTNKYEIDGLVYVQAGSTLTIPAGTVLYGDTTGDDYIVVEKGGVIDAQGTDAEPIYFTSKTSLEDPTAGDVGQWGGLTVLGDAPVNRAGARYEVDENNARFDFGGATAADNSGSLVNVHILNSGVTMSTDQEVNGLSLAGVGSGTTVDNIYVGNSSDDGIEIWGGTVNVTNATMVNCQDDSFDLDYGYVGNATNIYVHQTDAASHAGFEISSGGFVEMTSPTITNFVISKAEGTDEGGIYIKDDSTAPTFINGTVTTATADANIFTKTSFSSTQKSAIAFRDVLLLK
jgi:hypothetical protein